MVVYYLLAMVLFFQSGYGEVWNRLVAGLDWARRFEVRLLAGMQPSAAAITLARQRLGWQVMAALLEAVAGPLAGEEQERSFVAGMRLAAVDGMCLDVPATPENGAEFGYPGNDAGPGPFPQVRVVGLGECGTRAVLGAALSPLATGEQPLTRQLLEKLRPGDLLLADRNFLSYGLLKDVLDAGVHVLWRAKSDVDLPVLEVLADGDLAVADRRPGRVPPDAPQGRLRRRHSRHHRPRHRVLGDLRGRQRGLGDLHPGHRPARSRAAGPGDAAHAMPPAGSWKPASMDWETSIRGGAAVVLRSKSPPHDPPGDLRDALLLPGDPHPDQPRRRRRRTGPRQDLLHPRPRRNPQPHQRLRLLFP